MQTPQNIPPRKRNILLDEGGEDRVLFPSFPEKPSVKKPRLSFQRLESQEEGILQGQGHPLHTSGRMLGEFLAEVGDCFGEALQGGHARFPSQKFSG